MRRSSFHFVAVAALGTCAAFGATTGAPAGQPIGQLTQLRGAASCLASKPLPGCGRLVGVGDVRFRKLAVVSADGRSVYVAGGYGSLLVLRRNAATGVLSQPRGSAACATWDGTPPCLRMDRSGSGFIVNTVALHPDGEALYVGSEYFEYSGGQDLERTRFDVLTRNPRDGTLRRVRTAGTCFVTGKWLDDPGRCTVTPTVLLPNAIVVSPNGRNVYVSSSSGISVFRSSHGRLTQLPGQAGCLLAPAGPQIPGERDRCSDRPPRTGPIMSLVSSRDGRDLYALVAGDQRKEWDASVLLTFRRDAATGALERIQGLAGCLSGSPRVGCRVVEGLAGPNRFFGAQMIAGSPDGQSLYFANTLGILTVTRNADGSMEPRPGITSLPRGKASETSFSDMVVSGDGRTLYLAAGDSLVSYARDTRTGDLSRLQCFARAAKSNCRRVPSLSETVDAVTITPDGTHVYIVGTARGATQITAFSRRTNG